MVRKSLVALISLSAISCGSSGGGGGGGGPPPTYSLGGTVSGLAGAGLSLTGNGTTQNIAANGAFTIAGVSLTSGSTYNVTVAAQPSNPSQTCAVTGGSGSGTVASANVTSVQIACTTNAYSVGGTVTGLDGTGLVLQNNGGDDLTVAADGAITFGTNVASGAPYAVTVLTVPTVTPAQTCEVTTGTGTVGSGPVTNVQINCRPITGRFLYVANSAGQSVSAFSIDPTTGALTEVPGSPFTVTGDSPRVPQSDPTGKFLYVIGSANGSTGPASLTGYSIDATTGALAPIQGSGFPLAFPVNVALGTFNSTGTLLYLPVSELVTFNPENGLYGYRIDPSTGVLTAIGAQLRYGPSANGPLSFSVFDASQQFLYVPNSPSAGVGVIAVYAVNPTTGELTAIGSPVAAGAPVARAVLHPSGDFLYTRHNDGTTSGFTINPTTGELTANIVSVPTANGFGVVFAQDGRYIYLDALGTTFVPPSTTVFGPGSIAAFSIDQATGALSALAGSPYSTGGNSAIAIAINVHDDYVVITNLELGGAALPTIAVLELDSADGTLAHVVGSPFLPEQGTSPGAVIFDPSGQFAYISDNSGDFVSAYSVDALTGDAELIATYPTGDAPTGFLRIVGLQ